MKYLIVLLLCGCAPLNTQNLTFEQRMALHDRMRLVIPQTQFYPMQAPQLQTTCQRISDQMVQCY